MIKLIVKLVVSVGMLTLVIYQSDLNKLKHTFQSIPIWAALICMIGYACGPLLNCVRWMVLIRSAGIQTTYWRVLRAFFIGSFVNCFGLGTIGGDLTRGLLVAEGRPVKAAAMASVAADRLHGLAVLALVGSVSAMTLGHAMMPLWLVLTLGAIAPLIILGWLVGPLLLVKFFPAESALRQSAEQVAKVFPRKPSTILFITGISLIFHLSQISLHRFMGYSLGTTIPWSYLLVVVPFVNIVSSLPISWNGLGVRENAYKYFFAAVLPQEQAIAFGAIWLLSMTTASAIGGILSVLTPQVKNIELETINQQA